MARHPLADWLDAGDHQPEPEPGVAAESKPARRGRRWRLLTMAALPWAVLAGVLVGAGGTSAGQSDEGDGADGVTGTADITEHDPHDSEDAEHDASDPDAEHNADADAEQDADADAEQDTDADAPSAIREPVGDAPTLLTEPPSAVTAAATVAVRDHVNATDGPTRRYADLVVAEEAESTGSAWIVRITAAVLEGDEQEWVSGALERYAVPVSPEGRVLDTPWRVGDPSADEDPAPLEARWQPAGEHDADEPSDTHHEHRDAVVDALQAAGYRGRDVALEKGVEDAALLRATFREAGQHHAVWLTTEPEVRVLGARASPQ